MAGKPQLELEMRQAVQLELRAMLRDCEHNQRKLAAWIDMSPMTVSNALRGSRVSRTILDRVLQLRGLTEEELMQRHASEVGSLEATVGPKKAPDGAHSAVNLAIAALRVEWHPNLSATEREEIIRDVGEWILRDREVPHFSVATWYELLRASQTRRIYGRPQAAPKTPEKKGREDEPDVGRE